MGAVGSECLSQGWQKLLGQLSLRLSYIKGHAFLQPLTHSRPVISPRLVDTWIYEIVLSCHLY